MKINQVLMESAGSTVAFAFGRFNPAHQGHIEVWRTVEDAGANWFVGTNPNTIGPNDPLTFEQKSAWMEEIYPPISGHIVAQTSVLTLAAYIFKKTRKNERATVAYITDATDWAWSGKLLNQYNGVEGSHGYYKFAEITHVPSPRVSSATALRDAARADDKVAFYDASGTDPKLTVDGLSYFDTVKQACEKYPLPVKRGQKVKEQSVVEGPALSTSTLTGEIPTLMGLRKKEQGDLIEKYALWSKEKDYFELFVELSGKPMSEIYNMNDSHQLAYELYNLGSQIASDWHNISNPKFSRREYLNQIMSNWYNLFKKSIQKYKSMKQSVAEDDEQGEVKKQGQLIPWPAGTTKVHVSDVYDWYKLGMVISDLDDADPKMFGQGAPQSIIAFGSEEEESKLLPLLKRLGLRVDDIDPEGTDLDEVYHAGAMYEYLKKSKNQSMAETDSPAVAHTAKNLENPPKVMQHRAKRDIQRDKQWWDSQIAARDTGNDEWDEPKSKGSVKENASKMLSAHDKNGFITVIIQAPDGTKKAITNDNPRYINQWLMRYDLKLPYSITNKFKQFSLNEFAPSDDSHGDEKSYLLQLADDLFQAIYIARNKMAVKAVKDKIAAAGGDVKIVWNNNGSFNVVMFHPVHFKQGHLVSLVGDSDSQRMGESTLNEINRRDLLKGISAAALAGIDASANDRPIRCTKWTYRGVWPNLTVVCVATDKAPEEKKPNINISTNLNTNSIKSKKESIGESTITPTQVEAWGYRYNERDQRVMWRLNFDSEAAAHKWANSKNATIVEIRPVKQLAEDEQKTVAKTWDQMTPQEKSSGVKGRTVWNEKTQRYYTVFDVPVNDKEVDEAASLKTMRDFFAGDKNARDPFEITKQRMHFSQSQDPEDTPTKDVRFRSREEYEQWLEQNKLKKIAGPVVPTNDKVHQLQGPKVSK